VASNAQHHKFDVKNGGCACHPLATRLDSAAISHQRRRELQVKIGCPSWIASLLLVGLPLFAAELPAANDGDNDRPPTVREWRYGVVAAESDSPQCLAKCDGAYATCTGGMPNGLKACMEARTKCVNACK